MFQFYLSFTKFIICPSFLNANADTAAADHDAADTAAAAAAAAAADATDAVGLCSNPISHHSAILGFINTTCITIQEGPTKNLKQI